MNNSYISSKHLCKVIILIKFFGTHNYCIFKLNVYFIAIFIKIPKNNVNIHIYIRIIKNLLPIHNYNLLYINHLLKLYRKVVVGLAHVY